MGFRSGFVIAERERLSWGIVAMLRGIEDVHPFGLGKYAANVSAARTRAYAHFFAVVIVLVICNCV